MNPAQLAIGVAYWILPRFRTKRRKTRLVWLSFGLLNLGIWSVVVGGLVGWTEVAQLAGRLMEAAAVVAFAIHAWFRVKPPAFLETTIEARIQKTERTTIAPRVRDS